MYSYVFVVCGAEKHINTLDFSISYLKHFSNYEIIVVTDSSRNESPIKHNNIIDIKVPVDYNNHQASIWLKTSLHRILPKGILYCYLDSDVISVNKNCNNIFNYYHSPISFASDHCKIDQFSPYAINCNCLYKYITEKDTFEKAISNAINCSNYPPDFHNPNTRELYGILENIKNNPLKNIVSIFKMLLSLFGFKFIIKNNIVLDKKKKGFFINNEVFPFLFFYRKQIKEKTIYKLNLLKLKWKKSDNTYLAKSTCNHLISEIKNNFNIKITDNKWQHWNGGVFLFNDDSYDFLETWHQMTLKIFENNVWKIRDQGTLIATVWKYNLQNHPTLPHEFNFIADYYKFNIKAEIKQNNIVITQNNKLLNPNFIHVYHEFGTKGWNLWDSIEKIYN
ncbi:MAG: hypothetical protein HY951_04145 [Bacteroidia bacterium]|nr:hypothetical protein [Bacteroidia bacterium]